MPLNLIDDPWIPVRTTDGPRTIRPDQLAEPGVLATDWPRLDLNIACMELLIGLVFMADPPEDSDDWFDRKEPDPARLRDRLQSLVPAFNLAGEGPRFLQDLELLSGDPVGPDMLFMDSAGGNTAKNNADLFVRRNRYAGLPTALAAMALYTLQSQAPSGGAGNRTSMRGGGPMTTLVDPHGNLWDMVWANVPDGERQGPESLPWMRPTRTSEKGKLPTVQKESNQISAEVFFGMPRRLQLTLEDDIVTGVIQKPWGTEYDGWLHPLTPYYQDKTGAWLPQHPRPGVFGYRQWRGVVMEGRKGDALRRAMTLETHDRRLRATGRGSEPSASVLVAGWSMDNMKPREFILSRAPILHLTPDALDRVTAMIEAAEAAGLALRHALKPVVGSDDAKKTVLSMLHERFFTETEGAFLTALSQVEQVSSVAQTWLDNLKEAAMTIFHEQAVSGLDQRDMKSVSEVVQARGRLLGFFAGRGKAGQKVLADLGLEVAT